jgi:type I restriction enzyme S subunit
MELRAGYEQTDVGAIPEDWIVRTIRSVSKLVNGRGFKPFEWRDSGLPIIRIQNLNGSEVFNFYRGSYDKKLEVERGQLLFAWSGSRGTSFGPYVWDGPLGLLNYHTWKVCIDEAQIDQLFFHYALRRLTTFIEGEAHGASALVHVQKWQMEGFEFACPLSKAEQAGIAWALSDVDTLIASLEQLLGKKRQIKQGAMQELLTGKKRLPGFTGKWSPKAIGDLLQIHHGKSQHGVESPYGPCPILATGGQIGNANRFLCDQPSVLIGRKGTIDQPRYMDEPFWCVDTLFYSTVFVPNIPKFLFYCFCLIPWRQYNEASGVPSLNARTIEQLELRVPLAKEQEAIVSVLSDMDAEIAAVETKLTKARQIKQGMMQELLTGRIRLVRPSAEVLSFPAKESASVASVPHNTQINEAVVIAVLSDKFGSEQFPLGRFRRTKFSYLLHRHVEHEAAGFLKKAAGPYNPHTRYGGAEKIALQNRYVRVVSTGKSEGFVADDNIAQAEGYFEKWYGAEALTWLEQFRYQKNDALELLTTVDMACEDLSRVGKAATLSAVKQVIQDSPEWKAKLNRAVFSDDNIATTIQSCGQLFPIEEE